MSADAIVIGAGHNGLVAAAMLGRSGRRVLVLEARDHVGGMLGGDDNPVACMPFGLHPQVARAIRLPDLAMRPMETLAFGGGRIARISGAEAAGIPDFLSEAYRTMHRRLTRQASALGAMILRKPPPLAGADWSDHLALGRTALGLRGLGKSDLRELLRILLSNAHDVLLDELGNGPLSGALAMDATLGGAMGPRSPGTVLPLLYRVAHPGGARMMPAGGPGALAAALRQAAESAGAKIRTGAKVVRILVHADAVSGVRLAGGEEIAAPLVLSNAAPGPTLLAMLGVEHLDAEFVARCRQIPARGMVARIDFRLRRPLKLPDGETARPTQRLVFAPDMQAVETAFNAAKYGELPEHPVVEACVDDAGARLRLNVQFVPAVLKTGWNVKAKRRLAQSALAAIARFLPGVEANAHAPRVMTPADIEASYGAPGGHWHHGEFRADRLLMLRPFDGASAYAMPVGGLYLCGAGAHPGGDIGGAPGYNAARAALGGGRR